MTATGIITMIAMILGGLAFFLFGMSVLSGSLKELSGGALSQFLRKTTASRLLGFGLGAVITVAMQSSSAMTVMTVGLVDGGFISFADTYGMILGSNVGTTLTAWFTGLIGIKSGGSVILAFLNPNVFAPILAFAGIFLKMLSKSEKRINIGLCFLGFAVLMAGMNMMSNAVSSLKNEPFFADMLMAFDNPLIALLTATVFTAIIQSSAATLVIIQSLALGGAITLRAAVPLIIGANIGTCVTAIISGIGAKKEAKCVVALHIYINLLGGIICLLGITVINILSPFLLQSIILDPFGIALVHTLFNIFNAVVFLPLKKPILRLIGEKGTA